MKYIFVAGAPGSKWSSVVKNIYYSPDIDRSDYSDQRTYYHDASGTMQLMHLGAYYDPGMEFGGNFCKLYELNRYQCEQEFDRAFTGQGVRIIKSHVFCHHIDYLRQHWPDCPVILVHRDDDACLGWWVKCGHFDITYPLYHEYYKDLRIMSQHIELQNHDLLQAWQKHPGVTVNDNRDLCLALGITTPPLEYDQNYEQHDIKVKIIC